MNNIHRKDLSKFLGVDASELINVYTKPVEETIELTFDDDESSNNSSEHISDNNDPEYKSYYDLRILYDSWNEFENLREDFREFIPELLKNTDGMRNIFLVNENEEIRNKSPIEDEFNNALRKLVKFNNEPWVIEISRIIMNALRGVDTTINLMKLSLSDEESDELYRELAYGIIINIILETSANMGECEINRLCYFKCTKCNNETTYVFNEKDNKDICSTCWNSNT
jgi:hypothetical protein